MAQQSSSCHLAGVKVTNNLNSTINRVKIFFANGNKSQGNDDNSFWSFGWAGTAATYATDWKTIDIHNNQNLSGGVKKRTIIGDIKRNQSGSAKGFAYNAGLRGYWDIQFVWNGFLYKFNKNNAQFNITRADDGRVAKFMLSLDSDHNPKVTCILPSGNAYFEFEKVKQVKQVQQSSEEKKSDEQFYHYVKAQGFSKHMKSSNVSAEVGKIVASTAKMAAAGAASGGAGVVAALVKNLKDTQFNFKYTSGGAVQKVRTYECSADGSTLFIATVDYSMKKSSSDGQLKGYGGYQSQSVSFKGDIKVVFLQALNDAAKRRLRRVINLGAHNALSFFEEIQQEAVNDKM